MGHGCSYLSVVREARVTFIWPAGPEKHGGILCHKHPWLESRNNSETFTPHPPLIGFGYDGIALFAQYRTSDTALLGYGTLDAFGGHDHNSIGYHYHAHTVVDYQPIGLDATYKSTMHVLMKGAYIGKIDEVPYFRSRTINTLSTNKYMGGTVP